MITYNFTAANLLIKNQRKTTLKFSIRFSRPNVVVKTIVISRRVNEAVLLVRPLRDSLIVSIICCSQS